MVCCNGVWGECEDDGVWGECEDDGVSRRAEG